MKNNTLYHSFYFDFPGVSSGIYITKNLPSLEDLIDKAQCDYKNILFICDENTRYIAEKIRGANELPIAVLSAGEAHKNWASIESILKKAKDFGLGRDSLFVGIGGGVVTDMAAFSASIYMRGTKISLISTSLLGMVDAAAGGKTGFDLFDIKNLAGTFYPAHDIFMPLEALITLPQKEWKSGMAELIKTAIIGDRNMLNDLLQNRNLINAEGIQKEPKLIANFIAKSVEIKCHIVESDPQEKGSERMLLNLGHTFGHALESCLGLGSITHGEAVAWGIVRSAELGISLGITSKNLYNQIIEVMKSFDFEIRSSYPGMKDAKTFTNALMNDKKKKNGRLHFIVPDELGARTVTLDELPVALVKEITANA